MQLYYDRDADAGLIRSKRVAVLGFGSQGHAHALNLRDSGVKDLVVAGRPGASSAKAAAAGFRVMPNAQAAAWTDVGERLRAMMPWLAEVGQREHE